MNSKLRALTDYLLLLLFLLVCHLHTTKNMVKLRNVKSKFLIPQIMDNLLDKTLHPPLVLNHLCLHNTAWDKHLISLLSNPFVITLKHPCLEEILNCHHPCIPRL